MSNNTTKVNNPMKVITGKDTRWSYANVWEAKSINGGAPKFSVSLIIPKSDTVTVQNLDVVKVDADLNLIAVRGAVPGPKGGLVLIKSTVKTHRVKNVESGISNNPQKASGRNPQKASARNK